MNKYIVRFVHPTWTTLSIDKTARGLGEPYDLTESPLEIKLFKEVLDLKRAALIKEREAWAQFPRPELKVVSKQNASYELRGEYMETPGDSGRAKFRRLFGRRMYSILFPLTPRTDAAVGEYWDGFSKLGSLNDFEKNVKILSIIDNYIKLIDAIYGLQTGLSRLEEEPVETTQTQPTTETVLIPTTQTTTSLAFDFVTIELEEVPLLNSILANVNLLIDTKTSQFFDPSREYKTVANFGFGRQYVAEAWRVGQTTSSIQLKLTSPLEDSIELFDAVRVVRDVANSVIDSIEIELSPEIDNTPYLRPPNMDGVYQPSNQEISEVTITSLGLATGSVGVISGSSVSYEDRVFNRWYTSDFNSSELNIDFSDYNNFVYYSSAAARLAAFKNKLIKIESLAISASVSSSNIAESKRAIDIEYVKRNFDAYEQFLYYATNSIAYTASAQYTDSGVEYNPIASWPKYSDGTVYPTSNITASNWYVTQSAIASRFDEFNVNYLVRHLPVHIREDSESVEFLTLVAMFGHLMDDIKVYVDQFPNIYSTNPNPLEDLSMDQVYEVATSIGLNLPNAYALEELNRFVEGSIDESARVSVAETWKRMLHSAVHLSKAKGTRTAIDGVMNVYGINSPVIQLKETSYPSTADFLQSEELAYGLILTASVAQNIRIPFMSSSLSASTVQLRFLPESRTSSSILSGDLKWAINLMPHPSSSVAQYGTLVSHSGAQYAITPKTSLFGRLEVVSGSNKVRIASSSYFPLFDEDYTNIMLSSQSGQLTIIQTDGDQLLYTESFSTNLGTLWNTTTHIYLGGSGSIKSNINFNGIVDEVRVWGEPISYDLFVKQAYDPGSYYGTSYSSSYTSLYTDLSFSQPLASITASATNESPYVSSSLITLPAFGFLTSSYVKNSRTIKQFVPVVGSTAYSSNKVEVAPAPVFSEASLDINGVYTLSRTNSIKPLREKKYIGGQDIVMFSVSPIDFVNQTIMRTMGVVNINYLIGSPRKITNGRYDEADDMYEYYLEHYNKTVNPNEYIRFYKNAIKGPTEQVRDMVPARAKLIDGIVIESPILHRTMNVVPAAVRVDGTQTKTFLEFTDSASQANTASLAGAYSFDATYELYPEQDTLSISDAAEVYQYLNEYTLVTSSVVSSNSGIAFINANAITPAPTPVGSYDYYTSSIEYIKPTLTQSGYPRAPFLGVRNAIDSEENTLYPFYDIKPVSDFIDVGTTTYFHLSTGVYPFPSRISNYSKQKYKAEFAIDAASTVDELYVPITLLDPNSTTLPAREQASITNIILDAGATTTTTIRLASIFSLIGISGTAGLQITLTRLTDNQVVFSGVLDGNSDINPYVLVNADSNGLLQCQIVNTTGASIISTIVFYYYSYQPIPRIPRGYLPRHYKFYKNTSVAQSRRNITGCKIVYCPEGCPDGVSPTDTTSPVQITLSNNTGVVVNNPIPQTGQTPNPIGGVVQFGGSGPLDA